VATVTGLNAWSQSQAVPADAHGNNVAFACLNCNHPVLATLMPHQRGSSAEKPTQCRACSASYWVEVQAARNRLQVHRVPALSSGRYVAGSAPPQVSGPNAASWSVISAMLSAYGGVEYEELISAVRQHDHPEGGKAYIDLCIRSGWLRRA